MPDAMHTAMQVSMPDAMQSTSRAVREQIHLLPEATALANNNQAIRREGTPTLSNARELTAMKSRMWPALSPTEVRSLNWAAIANAAADAFGHGWTGFEVGSAAMENLGGARNLGAVIVANIRTLATQDPPRTPSPPAYDRAEVARITNAAAKDPSGWAAKVREAK